MWGTGFFCCLEPKNERFIPTHVGNSPSGINTFKSISVHPHACGEQLCNPIPSLGQCGSSPRMWGTVKIPEEMFESKRFIPTHVGNRRLGLLQIYQEPVHPHACGEQSRPKKPNCTIRGSSPRMWGTGASRIRQWQRHRFIPTHVGNSLGDHRPLVWLAVHPHACGEQLLMMSRLLRGYGSSPRMWGTDHRKYRPAGQRRFIPTHVGNRPSSLISRCLKAVHPHACGEQISDTPAAIAPGGSSPRMWGTVLINCQGRVSVRFIPTHVGNR